MAPNDPGGRTSCRICDLDQHARAFSSELLDTQRIGFDPTTHFPKLANRCSTQFTRTSESKGSYQIHRSMRLLDLMSALIEAAHALHAIDRQLFRAGDVNVKI
jgi:hypothetical protein